MIPLFRNSLINNELNRILVTTAQTKENFTIIKNPSDDDSQDEQCLYQIKDILKDMCKKDIETKIMLARDCNQVFLNYRDFY